MANTYDVVVTREFQAPIDRVWRAWTDPADLQGWWVRKASPAPAPTWT